MAQGKKHEPTDLTRQAVRRMARTLKQPMIAWYLDISVKTLIKYYKEELRESIRIKETIMQTCFDIAIEERDRTMLIFLAKTYCGMSENKAEEFADTMTADPVDVSITVNDVDKDKLRITKGK